MTHSKGGLRWGANFVALSAVLHVLGTILGGFSSEALGLLPFGIVYAGFAYGLLHRWRWLAYIVFIVLLVGTSLAVSNIWAYGDVPGWIFAAIAGANLCGIVALFGALWTPKTQDI